MVDFSKFEFYYKGRGFARPRPPLGLSLIIEIPNSKKERAIDDLRTKASSYGLTVMILKRMPSMQIEKGTYFEIIITPKVKPANDMQYNVVESNLLQFQAMFQGILTLENMDKDFLESVLKNDEKVKNWDETKPIDGRNRKQD